MKGNYRNKKIIDFAKDAPFCMGCLKRNDGTIVAAHSNMLCHGKGRGMKAHDIFVAFLCSDCHREIDQGREHDGVEHRLYWTIAHGRTWEWILKNGLVEIVVNK